MRQSYNFFHGSSEGLGSFFVFSGKRNRFSSLAEEQKNLFPVRGLGIKSGSIGTKVIFL